MLSNGNLSLEMKQKLSDIKIRLQESASICKQLDCTYCPLGGCYDDETGINHRLCGIISMLASQAKWERENK